MTLRQVYERVLIELNKEHAPALLIDDFNHFIMRAIYQYVNKRYNLYNTTQQTSDDLRVLSTTAILPAKLSNKYDFTNAGDIADNPIYEVMLPTDYFHILGCICKFKSKKNVGCLNEGKFINKVATRMTEDLNEVINNYYFKPSFKRPYYYIHNVNINVDNPTNPYSENNISGTDIKEISDSELVISERPRSIKIGNKSTSLVKRQGEIRYGNVSPIRMEIRYGSDNSKFELVNVYVEYLKVPQQVILTKEQLDLTEDTSQVMEFPDYVCLEIINELTHIIMENSSDPRLSTHIPISVSIADPAQAVGKK